MDLMTMLFIGLAVFIFTAGLLNVILNYSRLRYFKKQSKILNDKLKYVDAQIAKAKAKIEEKLKKSTEDENKGS